MTSSNSLMKKLIASYDRGMVVPFVGAGISTPNCVLWHDFIDNLENAAGIKQNASSAQNTAVPLVQRAAQVVRKIRNEVPYSLGDKVRVALKSKGNHTTPPPGSAALAKLWWPLVISTNYDDWFFTEWNKCHVMKNPAEISDRNWERMEICGRTDSDCHRIVNSLRAPDNPLLWAVQGFVGNLSPDWQRFNFKPERLREFESQLVVGHAEYRREAYRALAFRRALAEVFRSRSLLFIGSSLSEEYFGSLFDEVLELQGALPHMHYALIKQGSMDVQFLRERFQIHAIEVTDFNAVPAWIESLKEGIETQGSKSAMWGFRVEGRPNLAALPNLQIVWTKAPKPMEKECILISSGIDSNGNPKPSSAAQSDLSPYYREITTAELEPVGQSTHKVWRYHDLPVFAVAARQDGVTGSKGRDARLVLEATENALAAIQQQGFTHVYAMLLAAGRLRTFPSHISLIQMLRGYVKWHQKENSPNVSMTVCVIDKWTLRLMASGRLNVSEILNVNEVRFWLEIWRSDSEISRYSEFRAPETTLQEVIRSYDLPQMGWHAEIVPSPLKMANGVKALEANEIMTGLDPWTVADAGIMPGSIFRIILSK